MKQKKISVKQFLLCALSLKCSVWGRHFFLIASLAFWQKHIFPEKKIIFFSQTLFSEVGQCIYLTTICFFLAKNLLYRHFPLCTHQWDSRLESKEKEPKSLLWPSTPPIQADQNSRACGLYLPAEYWLNMAIPENREIKKWKFSFFCQRHALSTSFDIFVVTYRGTNFLPKLVNMLLFSTEKTEFPFLVFPYFRVMPLISWWLGPHLHLCLIWFLE